jgi:ribosomal protein L2
MNPCDHPHGGRRKSTIGSASLTPWENHLRNENKERKKRKIK